MKIYPLNTMKGTIVSSPSKSYSHRAFTLATLAKSPSYLINPLDEGDVKITIVFCKALGAKIEKFNEVNQEIIKSISDGTPNLDVEKLIRTSDCIYKISPPNELLLPKTTIDAKNSGTSIRLLSALVSLIRGKVRISGTFFDRERPMKPLIDALEQLDITVTPFEKNSTNDNTHAGIEITVQEIPKSEKIRIKGDISSQFITALMFLAPHLKINEEKTINETEIILTTPAKSFPYLKISEHILQEFGISFKSDFNKKFLGKYIIPADQSFPGKIYSIPGDFSSLAFIAVAASLNPFPNQVVLRNIDMNSPQGDKEIINLLINIGAKIEIENNNKQLIITGGNVLQGFSFDCSQTPDLFPILCTLGIFCEDITHIYNAEHVRIKETDRISLMVEELGKMGAIIEEREDGVLIKGPQQIHGSIIQHENDHRIAMALTTAALFARSPSELRDEDVVKDSYPMFFEDLMKLGLIFKK